MSQVERALAEEIVAPVDDRARVRVEKHEVELLGPRLRVDQKHLVPNRVVVVVDDDGGTESLLVSTFKLSAIDVPFDLMEDDDGDDDMIGTRSLSRGRSHGLFYPPDKK